VRVCPFDRVTLATIRDDDTTLMLLLRILLFLCLHRSAAFKMNV